MTPFFSIIIPTYNRGHLVGNAIESVLQQTFQDFEIVVVDDGSTDNTRAIVMKIADPRIKYIFKINEERGAARNHGVRLARGKYVCFLDSDDFLYSHHFETAHSFIQTKGNPEVFHLDYKYVDGNGKTLGSRKQLPALLNRSLLKESKISSNGVFIERNAAIDVPFIAHRSAVVAEDLYVWLRLAARYPFYHVPEVTSAIAVHDQRSLRNVSPMKFLKSMLLVMRHLSLDRTFGKTFPVSHVRHFFAHRMALSALLFADAGKKNWTRLLLRKSITYSVRIVFNRTFLSALRALFFKMKQA